MTQTRRLRLAAIQMCSTPHLEDNLNRASERIREAAERGADVVALPENFAFMGSDEERAHVAQDLNGEILATLKGLARERNINILGGSFLVKSSDASDGRPYNTSVFVDREGNPAAVYHKIHLFDVSLTDGASYRESKHIRPGEELVTVCREGVTFGLTICYDLRFPELYRALARKGAPLLRWSRAKSTGCLCSRRGPSRTRSTLWRRLSSAATMRSARPMGIQPSWTPGARSWRRHLRRSA